MTTIPHEPPAVKPGGEAPTGRTVRLVCWNPATQSGGVVVRQGRDQDAYAIAELDTGLSGRCFRVEKRTSVGVEAAYDVRLAGSETSCECLGWLRHWHCKHVDFLRALCGAGRLRREGGAK